MKRLMHWSSTAMPQPNVYESPIETTRSGSWTMELTSGPRKPRALVFTWKVPPSMMGMSTSTSVCIRALKMPGARTASAGMCQCDCQVART